MQGLLLMSCIDSTERVKSSLPAPFYLPAPSKPPSRAGCGAEKIVEIVKECQEIVIRASTYRV